jgi:hypothetical protein
MVATVDPLVFVSCSSTWSSGRDDVVAGAVPQGWRRSKANQVNGWKNDSQFIRASKASEALIACTGDDASWFVVDTARRKGLDASPVKARARGSEAMKPSIVCKAC